MKTTTKAGALGGAALIAAATMFVATPAYAETAVGDAVFYGESDFGVEDGDYPAGVDWFFGDVSGVDGPTSFGPAGLVFNDGSAPTGNVQILNQDVATPETAEALQDIIEDAGVLADDDTWSFQLPFFAEPADGGFTTLRPAAYGTLGGDWITSQAIAAVDPADAYAAGDTAPLADLLAALYAGGEPTLLGYGLFVDAGVTVTVTAVNFGETTSVFSPVPARTITPNPVSPQVFSTAGQGVTFTGTGWLPGSRVYLSVGLDDDDSEPIISFTGDEYTADENGNVSITVVLPTLPANGTYEVYFDDDGVLYELGALPSLSLTVAPQLAATGAEVNPWLIGTAALLALGGAGALVYARRNAVKA
jgi:hypothetical protein